jgi:DNA-directed RNA polymerase specialized sigma24 family protein
MEKHKNTFRTFKNIDSIIAEEKSKKKFRQILEKMGEEERQIIELKIFEKFSVKKIASQSKLSEQYIKKILRYGLLHFRNCFDASYYEEAKHILNTKSPNHITC